MSIRRVYLTHHFNPLTHHSSSAGHTDSRWRRRFFALKGHQLYYFRTAASAKPLAVLDLADAVVSASIIPVARDNSGNGSSDGDADGSTKLWVLKLLLQVCNVSLFSCCPSAAFAKIAFVQ